MARSSLPLRFVLAAALSVVGFSSPALAGPPPDGADGADGQLVATAASLPTPSLRTRLKARATAYRVVLETAETLGFDEAAVARMARAQKAPIVVAARTVPPAERD